MAVGRHGNPVVLVLVLVLYIILAEQLLSVKLTNTESNSAT